jgi:serine/threonine-protein kinase
MERDIARAEAARAEAALADTRQALERAEALRDFLVELFEATRPDRPHDELPSTAKILARGAERALDGDDVPAVERFGMLTTLARVYMAQSQLDKARPLAERALELAGSREAISPIQRARAMELKADLMTRAGDSLESVESLLVEAERLLPEAEERWSTLARIRLTRAWVDRHRQDDRRALARIEPVYETMPDAGVDRSLEATLYDSLATLYGATGKTDEALAFRRRATAAFRDAQGPEGQGHIVSLANGAGLAFTLGHFELAEDQARRAIAGYDRIYRDPVDYRAAVRNTLARILIARGAVTAAFETLERAGREYAAFMDKADDEWPLYHSLRGTFRLRLGRAQSAVADFERARSLLREQGGYGARLEATLDMLLAWGLCRAGSGQRGRALLASIDDPDTLRGPRIRAQVFEARAACRLAAGEAEAALSAAEKALATHAPPGRVLDAVDRQLLRARSLRSLGRSAAAERALDEAERRFLALGLERHPRLAELRRQRRIGELP